MITRRHYFCACLFTSSSKFINRIKRSLLQKEEKRSAKRSLSFSLETRCFCALCASLSFSVNCASTLSNKRGKREMTKRKEREREKKDAS